MYGLTVRSQLSTSYVEMKYPSQNNRLHSRCRSFQRVIKIVMVGAEQRKKFNKGQPRKGAYDKKLKANIALNRNILQCKNTDELLEILLKQQQMMNEVNVSTAAVVMARDILPRPKNRSDEKKLKNIDTVYTILCQLISKHIDKMGEQAVANSLWSLGKSIDILGPQKKEIYQLVFENLCARAMIVSNYLNTQGASNTLWSMAKFQWENQKQIQRIVRQAVNATKKNYRPQNISNILWSMATLKYEDLKATQHFVKLAKKCLYEMDSQEIANLLWALQQMRFYDQELNLEVENFIIKSNKEFDSQSIGNLSMAFTDFGLQNKQKVFEILVQQFILNNHFTSQNLTNFLYALAQLDCPLNLAQQVVEDCIANKIRSNNLQNFLDIHARQIMQAQIFYKIRGQKLLFPSDFEDMCKNLLQTRVIQKNSFTDAVFSVVQMHFEFAQKNVLICDDQIEINIALHQENKKKVAVEINPTQSYFVNCREKLLGRCQHHSFLLEQLGWQVVQVSSFKWSNNPDYEQQVIDDINTKLT